jgi:Rrf2 family protein
MFALTKKTDYALIALCHMAQHSTEISTAREIAAQFNMPPALLMNVLKTLNQRGLIRSIRGAKGGYLLAKPADQVSLSAIIAAVEGPVRFVQCASGRDAPENGCGLAPSCPVTKPVNKVHEKLNQFLQQVTLAQIAFDEEYGDPNRECLRMNALARMEPTT